MPLHQRTTANAPPPRVPTRRPLGVTGISGPPPGCGTTQVGMDGVITRPSGSVWPLIGDVRRRRAGAPGAGIEPRRAGVDRAAWPQPAASAARVRRLAIVFMPALTAPGRAGSRASATATLSPRASVPRARAGRRSATTASPACGRSSPSTTPPWGPAWAASACGRTRADDAALLDVLRLSEGMTYKNSLAGLPLGGGKTVVVGDPRTDKTPDKFVALGGFIDRLNGSYLAAEDVGTTTEDAELVATRTAHITGLPVAPRRLRRPLADDRVGRRLRHPRRAGRGRRRRRQLEGVHVAVQGAGHVGADVARHLLAAGARVTVADIYDDRVEPLVELGAEEAPAGGGARGRVRRLLALRAGRRGQRPDTIGGCAAGSSPAPPTTSWPTRRWATSCSAAASSTRRTSRSTPAA